jgi:hypothetical protein
MDFKDTQENYPVVDSSSLLKQLINKQIKTISSNKKLSYSDLKRIVKYIDTSIFNDRCCIWKGYVTNSKPDKNHKGSYVNFYFKRKKIALHRLLYGNFKEDIDDSDYLKYTCDNKGSCCNINHMVKFAYSIKNDPKKVQNKNDLIKKESERYKYGKDKNINTTVHIDDDEYYTISFM